MKKNINVGAYGWRHKHWRNTFYPDEIPDEGQGEDWLLTYYSNEFDTVLVPADYWCAEEKVNCESWLEDVHDDFQFFVECHPSIFECISVSDWVENLKKLNSQLCGLVVLDEDSWVGNTQLSRFLDSSDIAILGAKSKKIWRQNNHQSSSFAYVEYDLTDLRQARSIVEEYMDSCVDESLATIIVKHKQLQASDLAKFRSVLEIMGH